MRDNSFRMRVATGAFTLPTTVGLAALLWTAFAWTDTALWAGFSATLLLTYMLMELNNRYQLLRIRSRMVSSTFLSCATACLFLHEALPAHAAAVALVSIYFLLFSSYQQRRSAGRTFYAFAALTCGSIFVPPMLLLLPVLLLAMAVQLRTLTGRTLLAAVGGCMVPLAYAAAWLLWQEAEPQVLAQPEAWCITLPQWPLFSPTQWVNVGWLLWLTLLSLLHYYRTNFNDKIRVRMYFYIIIEVELVLWACLAVFPQHFDALFLLLLLNTAPLAAHYFALARGRAWMNAWFIVMLLSLVGLGLFNYGLLPFISL